jgi:predicted Zn-dependent peptidase
MAIEISKLKNGLTVATDPMVHLETAAIGVWVSAGGRYETEEVLGVSHFLEHMAFKGTTSRSALDIAEEIESVGGFLSAYTSREQTGYFVRCLKGDVPLAIDLLGDILMRSTFEPDELERERGVILQEIGQCADNPEDLIYDLLQDATFSDQALGRPILGTQETVGRIDQAMLRGHMKQFYGSDSMWVVGAGAVDHGALVALCEQAFDGLEALETKARPEPGQYVGGARTQNKDFEQVHLTLGFPGVAAEAEDFYVAQVYSEILGGGMSSRLFQEVREKRGLCYSVYSFHSGYADTGMFGIYAGTSASDANELISVITSEMERLATHVEEKELARSLAQVKAGVLMSLESAYARAEWVARHLPRFGRVLSPEELVKRFESVDAVQLKRFGTRLMETDKPAFAALGPVGGLDSYDRIAARFGG